MAFDFTVDGNFSAMQKIMGLDPYFYLAIFYLSQISESISLPEDRGKFEISSRIVTPSIVLIDDPYPIVQCKKRIFSGQSKIEISYGIFVMLGIMGEFEKTINTTVGDMRERQTISNDILWDANIDNLILCIKDALDYLKWSYNAFPDMTPKIPKMTLNTDLLYDSLKFIVGHEISHYLDLFYNYDVRTEQQVDVLRLCLDTLSSLKRTPYKNDVDTFLQNVNKANKEQAQFLSYWSEEVLADFEGFHYLCNHAPSGYLGNRRILAISIAYVVMRLVEYFESKLTLDAPKLFSIPIKWREFFLQSILYQKYYSGYDTFDKFLSCEWGVFRIVSLLYERVIYALELEEHNKKAESIEKSEEINIGFSSELSRCEELFARILEVSLLEAEKIVKEIENIYDTNSADKQFCSAFQAEKLAEIMQQIGLVYYGIKSYQEAYNWFYSSTTYYERSDDLYSLSSSQCYYQLGLTCYEMGYYDEASSWLQYALFIREQVHGLSFKDNIDIYFDLARIYVKKGTYNSAVELFRKIHDCTENDDVKAEVFRYMGIIGEKVENNNEALEWFLKALVIKSDLYGKESMEAASLYNSIGSIYSNLKKFEDAEKYLMHAFRIKINAQSIDILSLSNTTHNLGILELRRKRQQKAQEWLQSTLKTRLSILGDNHPLVADTYQAIGSSFFLNKDYENSLKHHNQALKIYNGIFGENSIQAKRTEAVIGRIKELMKRGE